jgi:hypothetical protein
MKTSIALVAALLMTAGIPAVAAETAPSATASAHSKDSMVSGSHAMAGQKQNHMSDRVMSSQNPKCTDEALAKMPAEHRATCGK